MYGLGSVNAEASVCINHDIYCVSSFGYRWIYKFNIDTKKTEYVGCLGDFLVNERFHITKILFYNGLLYFFSARNCECMTYDFDTSVCTRYDMGKIIGDGDIGKNWIRYEQVGKHVYGIQMNDFSKMFVFDLDDNKFEERLLHLKMGSSFDMYNGMPGNLMVRGEELIFNIVNTRFVLRINVNSGVCIVDCLDYMLRNGSEKDGNVFFISTDGSNIIRYSKSNTVDEVIQTNYKGEYSTPFSGIVNYGECFILLPLEESGVFEISGAKSLKIDGKIIQDNLLNPNSGVWFSAFQCVENKLILFPYKGDCVYVIEGKNIVYNETLIVDSVSYFRKELENNHILFEGECSLKEYIEASLA